jgi:hypothetical protein
LYSFSPTKVLVMTGWPRPRAWVKTARAGWRHGRKDADAFWCGQLFAPEGGPPEEPPEPELSEEWELEELGIFPEAMEDRWGLERWQARKGWEEQRLLAAFFDTVPEPVRRALLRYPDRRWHLLNLFARCPGALDLHASTPALCYMLASNWVFHTPAVKQPIRAARSMVRRKQREILGWLGFPATTSARNALRKLDPATITVENLLYLRDTLNDPGREPLVRQLPRLSIGALRLLNDPRLMNYASPRLLREIAACPDERSQPYSFRMLLDTCRMETQLNGGMDLPLFRDRQELRRRHDWLSVQVESAYSADYLKLPEELPPPPYRGTPEIVPISTTDGLREEGRTMRHCAGSYVWDVAEGRTYLYQVLTPVRATLSIVARGGGWRPGQMVAMGNQAVAPDIRTTVFDALLRSPRGA